MNIYISLNNTKNKWHEAKCRDKRKILAFIVQLLSFIDLSNFHYFIHHNVTFIVNLSFNIHQKSSIFSYLFLQFSYLDEAKRNDYLRNSPGVWKNTTYYWKRESTYEKRRYMISSAIFHGRKIKLTVQRMFLKNVIKELKDAINLFQQMKPE